MSPFFKAYCTKWTYKTWNADGNPQFLESRYYFKKKVRINTAVRIDTALTASMCIHAARDCTTCCYEKVPHWFIRNGRMLASRNVKIMALDFHESTRTYKKFYRLKYVAKRLARNSIFKRKLSWNWPTVMLQDISSLPELLKVQCNESISYVYMYFLFFLRYDLITVSKLSACVTETNYWS